MCVSAEVERQCNRVTLLCLALSSDRDNANSLEAVQLIIVEERELPPTPPPAPPTPQSTIPPIAPPTTQSTIHGRMRGWEDGVRQTDGDTEGCSGPVNTPGGVLLVGALCGLVCPGVCVSVDSCVVRSMYERVKQ